MKTRYIEEIGQQVQFPDDMSDKQIDEDIRNYIIPAATGKAPATTLPGQFKEFGKAVVDAVPRGGISAVRGFEAMAKALDQAMGGNNNFRPLAPGLKKSYEDSSLGQALAPNPGYEDSIGRTAGQVIGSTIPLLATSAVGGTPVALAAAISQGAGQQAENIDEQRLKGKQVSDWDEGVAALLGGAIGATELLPLNRLMGPINGALGRVAAKASGRPLEEAVQKGAAAFVKSAAVQAVEEGAQEGASQFLNNAVEQQIYNPERGLMEGVGTAAVAGAFGGAAIDATIGHLARSIERKQLERTRGPEKFLPKTEMPAVTHTTNVADSPAPIWADPVEALRQVQKIQEQQPQPAATPDPAPVPVAPPPAQPSRPVDKAAPAPVVPETGIDEGIDRATDKRERLAKEVLNKPWAELTNSERIVIDGFIAEGYGSAQPAPQFQPEPVAPVSPPAAPLPMYKDRPQLAQEIFGAKWNELTPEQQQAVDNYIYQANVNAGRDMEADPLYSRQLQPVVAGASAQLNPQRPTAPPLQVTPGPTPVVAPDAMTALGRRVGAAIPQSPASTATGPVRSPAPATAAPASPAPTPTPAYGANPVASEPTPQAPKKGSPQNTSSPQPNSNPWRENVKDALRQGRAFLNRLGGVDLNLRFMDALVGADGNADARAEGSYANSTVNVKFGQDTAPEKLLETISHEVVHAFRKADLITKGEWDVLSAKAKADPLLRRIQQDKDYGKLSPEQQIEEVVARQMGAYFAGTLDPKGQQRGLFNRANNFLERLRNGLKSGGFYTAADVRRRLDEGDIGRRNRKGGVELKPGARINGNQLSVNATTDQAEREKAPAKAEAPAEVAPTAAPPSTRSEAEILEEYRNRGMEPVRDGHGQIPDPAQPVTEAENALHNQQFGFDHPLYEAQKFSYAGIGAFDREMAPYPQQFHDWKRANMMEFEGSSQEEIRQKTGWFRSPYDKRWRFEIDDSKAKMTPAFGDLPESNVLAPTKPGMRLQDVLQHPDLYQAYPALRDVPVTKHGAYMDYERSVQGSYNPKANYFNITPYAKDPTSTLLHEIQHWIQEREGFATGGNESSALKAASPERVQKAVSRLLEKKQRELDSAANEVKAWKVAMDIRAAFPGEVAEARELTILTNKLYKEYAKDQSNKQAEEKWWESAKVKIDKSSELTAKIQEFMASKGLILDPTTVYLRAIDGDEARGERIKERFANAQKEVAALTSGDAEAVKKALSWSNEPFEMYRSLAGEIESRDVQHRQALDQELRKKTVPYSKENIAPEDAIVVYEDDIGESRNAPDGEAPSFSKKLNDSLYEPHPATDPAILDEIQKERQAGVGNRLFYEPKEDSIWTDILDLFSDPTKRRDFITKIRQGMVDRRARIYDLAVDSAESADDLMADVSPYAAAIMKDRSMQVASAVLTGGHVQYKDGVVQVDRDKGRGLMAILRDVADKGLMANFVRYVGAKRANLLMTQGREQLFTPRQIELYSKMDVAHPELKDFLAEYESWNNSLVDFLADTGRLSKEQAAKWKANPYIPFYRALDPDGAFKAPAGTNAIGGAKQIKKLTGGENVLIDPIQAMIRNATSLIDLGMSQIAADRTIKAALKMKWAARAGKGSKKAVTVYNNGVAQRYEINDPLLYEAMMASDGSTNWLTSILAKPAQILREAITITPTFMVRNMMRDTIDLTLKGDYKVVPFLGAIDGALKAYGNNPLYKDLVGMGIVGQNAVEGGSAGAAARFNRQINAGGDNIFMQVWNKAHEYQEKSEAANRIKVYEDVLARTGNKAQAAYEALEAMNFSRRGASPIMQILTPLVPFFNARLQGLDVMYRNISGQGVGGSTKFDSGRARSMRGAMITRMLMMAGVSSLYAMAIAGSKVWQNAPPEERDNYWFIPFGDDTVFRLPIPFELGAITKTVPERLWAWFAGVDEGKDVANSVSRILMNNLFEVPVPQFMKPVAENYFNKSIFRGREIENQQMQALLPEERWDDYTSQLARQIGKATGKSPLMIDNLLKGYTGTVGVFVLSLADRMLRPEDQGERPADAIWNTPGIGAFFQRPDGPSRLMAFYEFDRKVDEVATTLRKMEQQPASPERIKAFIESHKRELSAKGATDSLGATLRDLRKARALISNSRYLTSDQKRQMLDEFRKREVAVSKQLDLLKARLPE